MARSAMHAVVSITTQESEKGGKGDNQDVPKGLGAGFIIRSDGYVLTSAHVIEDTSDIRVSIVNRRGFTEEFPARVVGQDPQTDTALLKINAGRRLPILPLGSSRTLEVADWVVAIGNPFGLGHSVSVGVVSYKGRTDVNPTGRTGYFDYLQTDAAINPGNSGGPIINVHGEVVAIANAVNISGQGIGFAVPIDLAKDILPQLYASGTVKRGWLGAAVRDLTPYLSRQLGPSFERGVLVSEVFEKGPAAKAGLQVGDLILGVNQLPVDRAPALRWKVSAAGVGHWVDLAVRRLGKPVRVRVHLAEVPRGRDAMEETRTRVSDTMPADTTRPSMATP